jgi:ATP-binding cassette subfamily B protein
MNRSSPPSINQDSHCHIVMNYKLNNDRESVEPYNKRLFSNLHEIGSYLNKKKLYIALALALVSSISTVVTPYLLGQAIDTYIIREDVTGLLRLIGILAIIYLISAITDYFQQRVMGEASQQALYRIRGIIFEKIQSLPIAFFSQNKTGDLMSRINNDSDKLSQFLSESILRFTGSVFTFVGIAGFVLYLNWKLGLVLLSSTLFLFALTRIVSPLLERANKQSSGSLGAFTAGVSEQLTNFKAIVAFDRREFFDDFLSDLNQQIYRRSRLSAFLNQVFPPFYDFAGYLSQSIVLVYGIYLVSQAELTIGLLIAFLGFTLRFYDPLRWIADIMGQIQVSLASWGRIKDILSLESNLVMLDGKSQIETPKNIVMTFNNVSFGYGENRSVLDNISFTLEEGKTYALVGPTGGGKSTIASLMSRLYDPTEGSIVWKGKDIRNYEKEALSNEISVILQEPYLFTGTVAANIVYGNASLASSDLLALLEAKGMTELLKRLPEGLDTKVETSGENISIGQKQLISFVRTVLREPKLLILDEATANIDTVTESTLQTLIDSLGYDTTKVIIAHRLNTIKKADEILFVSGGEVKRVSDEKEVLELLKASSKS